MDLKEEKKLLKKGYKWIIGLDESGRGSLAGPVVAAGVMIKNQNLKFKTSGLKDSKKLSPKKREEFYKFLTRNSLIEWKVSKVSQKIIDKINIFEATKLAMKRAIKNLISRIKIQKSKLFLIIDGNFKLDLPISQKSIVKADEKIFSCGLASILAKVKRDKIMIKYHKKYPRYGFDKNKGYPTKFHRKMIKKYGISKIHRKSFKIL